MSKKTNAEKMKAKQKQPRKRLRVRGKRPNPAMRGEVREIKMPRCLSDPLFMLHAAAALTRYLELEHPAEAEIVKTLAADPPAPPETWGVERVSPEEKPE